VKEPEWLLREVVLAVHEQLLARFGGLPGVRDDGLLDSALAKPPSLFTYSNPSLFELAASYGYGIIQNHPFVDGNKRTGFLAAVTFLDHEWLPLDRRRSRCRSEDSGAGCR